MDNQANQNLSMDMKLGQLALLTEKGIFYTQDMIASQDRFSDLEQVIHPDPAMPKTLPNRYRPTVVEESTAGEYITGVFKDQTDLQQAYEVTVWLLIETEE